MFLPAGDTGICSRGPGVQVSVECLLTVLPLPASKNEKKKGGRKEGKGQEDREKGKGREGKEKKGERRQGKKEGGTGKERRRKGRGRTGRSEEEREGGRKEEREVFMDGWVQGGCPGAERVQTAGSFPYTN